jgi:hypothetical protein
MSNHYVYMDGEPFSGAVLEPPTLTAEYIAGEDIRAGDIVGRYPHRRDLKVWRMHNPTRTERLLKFLRRGGPLQFAGIAQHDVEKNEQLTVIVKTGTLTMAVKKSIYAQPGIDERTPIGYVDENGHVIIGKKP